MYTGISLIILCSYPILSSQWSNYGWDAPLSDSFLPHKKHLLSFQCWFLHFSLNSKIFRNLAFSLGVSILCHLYSLISDLRDLNIIYAIHPKFNSIAQVRHILCMKDMYIIWFTGHPHWGCLEVNSNLKFRCSLSILMYFS